MLDAVINKEYSREQDGEGRTESCFITKTIDKNYTYAQSPENYSDSKYHFPGQKQSAKSVDHLVE